MDTALQVSTGLLWRRTSLTMVNYAQAAAGCASFGAGWRLPTSVEVVDVFVPTVDAVTFPDVKGSYWTSTVYGSGGGWHKFWAGGALAGTIDTNIINALCVKG